MKHQFAKLFTKTLLLLGLCGFYSAAHAVDGVIEINQARALAGGVTPGDTPGFPVTLDQPGSYRLTGNLDLSAQGGNVSGIVVSAPAVMVDLGGFQIAGPTTCSGSGTTISCNPASTGTGSYGVWFTNAAIAGVVKNGFVRNMTDFGILGQATGLRVQGITALHNGRDGINSTFSSQIINCVAAENGAGGIEVNTGSVVDGATAVGNGGNGIYGRGIGGVITRASGRENGLSGFNLGRNYKYGKNNTSSSNELDDRCGGGICTEIRRFYLTKTEHQGNTVLTACAAGFHTASITELQGQSSYIYDYILGAKGLDSGNGALSRSFGWIRSGDLVKFTIDNTCEFWSSNSSTEKGKMFGFEKIQSTLTSFPIGFDNWELVHGIIDSRCNLNSRVWCIEGEAAE